MNHKSKITIPIILIVLLLFFLGLPKERTLSKRQLNFPNLSKETGIELLNYDANPVKSVNIPEGTANFDIFDQNFVNLNLRTLVAELVAKYTVKSADAPADAVVYHFSDKAKNAFNKYPLLKDSEDIKISNSGVASLLSSNGEEKLLYDFGGNFYTDKASLLKLYKARKNFVKQNSVYLIIMTGPDDKGFDASAGLTEVTVVFKNKKGKVLSAQQIKIVPPVSNLVNAATISASSGSKVSSPESSVSSQQSTSSSNSLSSSSVSISSSISSVSSGYSSVSSVYSSVGIISSASSENSYWACICDGINGLGKTVRSENSTDNEKDCKALCPPSKRDSKGWCTNKDSSGTEYKVKNCKWEKTTSSGI